MRVDWISGAHSRCKGLRRWCELARTALRATGRQWWPSKWAAKNGVTQRVPSGEILKTKDLEPLGHCPMRWSCLVESFFQAQSGVTFQTGPRAAPEAFLAGSWTVHPHLRAGPRLTLFLDGGTVEDPGPLPTPTVHAYLHAQRSCLGAWAETLLLPSFPGSLTRTIFCTPTQYFCTRTPSISRLREPWSQGGAGALCSGLTGSETVPHLHCLTQFSPVLFPRR